MSKTEKILLVILIFFLVVVGVEAFLLYQKGYFKPVFKKVTVITPTPSKPFSEILPVSAVSDIPGYELEIVDSKLLNHYLEDLGFKKGSSLIIFGEDNPQMINELIVHLTNKEQHFLKAKVGEEGKVVYSIGNYLNNGKLHLLVYLGEDLSQEGVSLGFDRTFLQAVYKIASSNKNINLDREGFDAFFEKFREKNFSLFKITKKG
jgi:hypothetical protein